MTADRDFQDIFDQTDLLLVVDEWKGFKLERPARILGARAFTNTCRSTLQLYRLLATSGAADWHASGKRAEKSFLFKSPAFDLIMLELDRADTCLYNYLERDLSFFRPGGPAEANWRRIMAESPGLASVWDVDAPHAKSLFWFLDCWI